MNRPVLLMVFGGAAAIACVHAPPKSWVEGVPPEGRQALVCDVVELLKTQAPPAKTIWVLEPAGNDGELSKILRTALVQAGYGVAQPGVSTQGLTLSYRITPAANGLVLRLLVGERIQLARWYRRDGKLVVAKSPVAVGRWP